MLIHPDYLGGMYNGDAQSRSVLTVKLRTNLLLVTDQHNLTVIFLCGSHRSLHDLPRCKVSTHRVNRYTHPALPSSMPIPHRWRDTTINLARKTSLSSR